MFKYYRYIDQDVKLSDFGYEYDYEITSLDNVKITKEEIAWVKLPDIPFLVFSQTSSKNIYHGIGNVKKWIEDNISSEHVVHVFFGNFGIVVLFEEKSDYVAFQLTFKDNDMFYEIMDNFFS